MIFYKCLKVDMLSLSVVKIQDFVLAVRVEESILYEENLE